MEFTPGLANQNTSEFKTLATSLEEELKKALFDRQTLLYGSFDITVKVLEFKSGSVIVLYRVGWLFKPGVHNSADPLTKDNLKTRLQAHLRKNDGFLYNYRMPISSLKSNRVLDNCQVNNNNCSDKCHFNSTMLLFTCSCPVDYILDSDGKTCIENYINHLHHSHHEDTVSSSTEHTEIVEHHRTPAPQDDMMDPTVEPSDELEPSTDHQMPQIPPIEPEQETSSQSEPSHDPEISTEREELPVPSQEPEHTPEPESSREPESSSEQSVLSEPSHEPNSSSEQSVSSEPSLEQVSSSSEAEPSQEWYPEPEHEFLPELNYSTETKEETSPNTEPILPTPEEPESSSKHVPVVDFIPPVTEIPTEHAMYSESDSYHPETSSESVPEPLTEYTYHEPSEESHTTKEETVSEVMEIFKPSEESKPMSELTATTEPHQLNEESIILHNSEPNNETEHKTKIISGYVPITAQPTPTTTTSSASISEEPNPENGDTFNQTEHGAGSMRSMNLEHSTGYVTQTNEMEHIMANDTIHPDEIINSTLHLIAPLEPEVHSIITTEMPTTMEPNLGGGAITSVEPESTEVSSMKHLHELNETEEFSTKLDHSDDDVLTEVELSPTNQVQPSTETYHTEEMNTLHELVSGPEKNSTTQTEMDTQTTFSPLSEVITDKTEMISSTTSTEKPPLVISSSDIKVEMGNTDTPSKETTLIYSSNDTMIGEGEMNTEFELGITHKEEPVQRDNETMTNQPLTTVVYKHEVLNTTDNVTMSPSLNEPDAHTEPDLKLLNVSTHYETTIPYLKMETVKPFNDVTTQLPIHLGNLETTMYTTMMDDLNKEEKETMADQKVTLGANVVKEVAEDQTTVPPTTIKHLAAEENQNITTENEFHHHGLMGHDDSTTLKMIIPTTMKQKENEEAKMFTTTIRSTEVMEISGNTEVTTDSNNISSKDKVTEKNHEEPMTTVIRETSSQTGDSTKSLLESTEQEEPITATEVNHTLRNASYKSDDEKVTNFVTEAKTEFTTIAKLEIPEKNNSNDVIKAVEMVVEHTTLPYNVDLNQTSSEQTQIPLHTPNTSPEIDETPMIPITLIPDLAGPFSVDTIIDHSTPYIVSKPEEDINNGVQVNQTYHFPTHVDDHSTDITADTLNSLDDDYNEEDKKKYYKPAKTKNFKNFKIQEVNIPIDSLADETTKDIQHSKDVPYSTSNDNDVTTLHPTVVREEINSNDAFTTITPLFKEEKSSTKPTPHDLPLHKDEHLNGLFFSNEAETTITPIFGYSLNITGKSQNKTELTTNNNNHFEDGINQLETKVVSDDKEEITTELTVQKEVSVLRNLTMETDNLSMNSTLNQPEIIQLNNTINLNITNEPEMTTMKPENLTEVSSVKLPEKEPISRQFNSSGLLEILNPSKKCAIGQFACADGSGCITTIQRCDAVRDCEDGSDELNCEEQGCLGNFQCKNGQCLKRSLVCDSEPHCSDGSDESDCETWKCQFDEVKCPNSGQCIPVLWKCDGKGDCRDNADEFDCRDSCANDEFFCPERRCIPHNSTCDGKNDCLKGEDEMNCRSA